MPETPPLVETEGEHDRAEQFNVVSDSASVLQEDKEATDSDNGTSLDLAVSADDGEVGVVAVAKPALTKEEEERQQQELEALREKYKDWPMKSIEEPHDNDVLYGRGGGTNHHPGNKRFRRMVEDRKVDYINSKRLDKPLVALEIIKEWRGQLPPGRFLKLDEKSKRWNDVGDKKAREKTSQALREKAPLLRQQQEEERRAKERVERGDLSDDDDDVDNDDDDDETEGDIPNKSTRFASGTNSHDGARSDGVSKAVLARDHSLGRDYISSNDAINLEGFSWQEPFVQSTDGRTPSQGSYPAYPGQYPVSSHGSMPVNPPLQAPGFCHARSGDERHLRYTSSGRYESWSSVQSGTMVAPSFPYPHRSGSWSRDASGMGEREHSLGQNPLPYASVVQPAPAYPFDYSRGGSGQWFPNGSYGPPPPYHYPPAMPGPGPVMYPYSSHGSVGAHPAPVPYPSNREYSGGPPPAMPPPRHRPTHSNASTPSSGPPSPLSSHSPQFEVGLDVASTWSGRKPEEIAKTLSSDDGEVHRHGQRSLSPKNGRRELPKPDLVKRATSNQNETLETKPDLHGVSIKRAALNRDQSATANRLKQQYLPEFRLERPEQFDETMRQLSTNLAQSTLFEEEPFPPLVKPYALTETTSTSTIDQIAMELMVKPAPINRSNRSSTIEALALELDEFPLVESDPNDEQILRNVGESLSRPHTLTFTDRLTTGDVMDLLTESIPDDDLAVVAGRRQLV